LWIREREIANEIRPPKAAFLLFLGRKIRDSTRLR